VQYDALVERVWPGGQATISVLGGGITNHNLKVELETGEAYVLRIAGRDTALLGIDRRVEYEASLAAAAVGVGPEVVDFLEPEGYLVTRFVAGEIVPAERMQEPETIQRVAAALRAVHNGPPLSRRFDAFRVVEEYRSVVFAHGGTVPSHYEPARELARQIERVRGPAPERPCHNDLLNANFIDDGSHIRIVDWEYAGMGDVFFDLANFAVNHGLDVEARGQLLASYFDEVRPDAVRALELMRFMSGFREAMWGVVQQAISELDFDFEGYAEEQFGRIAAIAEEPAFEAALNGEIEV
jgi:thiamine kinase-like enzyme